MPATMALIERITIFCFAASYSVALGLELLQLFRPRPVQRLVSLIFGGAGLLAHTLFIAVQPLPLASQSGSALFLAWILAMFYLYGSVHHRRLAWGVFVLPLVLGLVGLAEVFAEESVSPGADPASRPGIMRDLFAVQGERFWGLIHGGLILLAAVGVCVGFVASVMYLVQVRRLRAKALPGRGVRLLSLERLEAMNRRAIILAFPLLTAGLLVGAALLAHAADRMAGWTDPKVLSALVLWLVFAILLYLRYGVHLRGRRLALLTIVAFALLVFTLAWPHTLGQGGVP
jgi:ABC-type transport system involved in cytochrome c biogenesis permease subunit